jgi:hypothetical protein
MNTLLNTRLLVNISVIHLFALPDLLKFSHHSLHMRNT